MTTTIKSVLKTSQLLGFALPALTATALAQDTAPGVVALTPGEMHWASQGGLATAGMEQLNLVGDPGRAGPYTLRLKFPKGLRIAPHTHPDSREVTLFPDIRDGLAKKFDTAKLKVLPAGSTPACQCSSLHRDRRGYRHR